MEVALEVCGTGEMPGEEITCHQAGHVHRKADTKWELAWVAQS